MKQIPNGWSTLLAGVACSLLMVACGGGGSGETTATPEPLRPVVIDARTLFVSQFGSGSVLAPDGQFVCSGQNCSKDFPLGETVKLAATPSPGWILHHWSGCDSQSGSDCVVTLSDHKTVHPMFARVKPPVLKADVVMLTSATMQQLVSNEGGVLIFRNAAAQIATLPNGSVIYSTIGEGLLRRVTSIIALPGGNFIVDTMDATASDVVAEGTLILDGRASTKLTSSARVLPAALSTFDLDIVDGAGSGIRGKATLDLEPEVALDFDLRGVTEFKFIVNPKVTLGALSFAMKEGIIDREKSFDISALALAPVVVGPIVLTPAVVAKGRLKGDIKVGVELNGQASAGGAVGTHYVRSAGWRGVGNFNMAGTFNPLDPIKVKGSGKVETSVAVQASLKLYGVVGPTLDIGPFVRASGSDTVSKDEACIQWSIEAGARAQAGGEVRVLGYSLADYKATLLEYSRTLADGAALKCKDTESPSKVDSGTVQAVSATQLQISWPSATDNVWVSGYTLTRNAKRIGDSSTNALLDTGLQPNTEYCYSVVAFDKSGNRSADGKVFCGKTLPLDVDGPQAPAGLVASPLSTTAVGLSWGQASDAGGIDGYVVYQNGVEIGRSSDTSFKLTKLRPTTRYCYRVAAIGKTGNVGAKSGETCTTTLTTPAWNMKIKCSDSDFYVVEKDVDLDVNSNQSLSVVGNATDYNGGAMAYQLLGVYVPAQSTLSGRINWTFASSSNVRADEFSVGLNTNDTGNSTMRQVQVTGCTTQIRFVRKPTAAVVAPAAARPAVPAGRSGSVSGQ